MRTRREWWIVLGVGAFIVGMGAMLWIGRVSRTPRLPEVGLKRESLGQFPTQPGAPHVETAFPVDLDSDGETEAVAVFARLSRWRGNPSVWSNLKGRFEPLPVPVFPTPTRYFYPLMPMPDGGAPLLTETPIPRELLGWDETSKQIVRIHLQGSRFLTVPASDSQFERFPTVSWMDADGDGTQETVLATWHPTQGAFRLNRDGRWDKLLQTPLNPEQAVNQLLGQVSTTKALPTGQTQIATPTEFFYQLPQPIISLPDGDGDDQPEQLDVLKRLIRFSKGGTTPFPHPFQSGEQIIVAELDGVAPREILYASRSNDPAKVDFQLWVYRLQGGKLQRVAVHQLLKTYYIALTITDLDGDGRDEIIGNHAAPGGKTRWLVWQLVDGVFQERTAEHPVNLKRLGSAHWLKAGRNTLMGETTHELSKSVLRLAPAASSETGDTSLLNLSEQLATRSATVLVGLPEGEHRADPKHWNTLAVDGRILWYGDYDGDGVEEYVLSNLSDGGIIAQFRGGKWQRTLLKHGAMLVAAFPAKRNGVPQLILVYRDGKVEAVQITR